jgi:cardiolipin synthase
VIARIVLALAIVASNGTVSLVGVYPNPATDGDAGEYVVIDVEEETSLEGYALTDGEDTVHLPNTTVDGRVAITDDDRVAAERANETTLVVPSGLALSNAGETVTLLRDGESVSQLSYERAPTAKRWDGDAWAPLGETHIPVATSKNVSTTAFSFPDSPAVPLDVIESADDRVLLAGYTVTDESVVDALIEADRRNVSVRVLVDESPVGGTAKTQIALLDHLRAAGIEVTALGGPRARYDFHHAKYAVADETVFVTSENWKPAGVGGHASRGWGVTLQDEALAKHLQQVYAADAEWDDGRSWDAVDPDGQPSDPSTGNFPTRFEPRHSSNTTATVIVAPDNAERELVSLLGNATESIRIQQVSVDPEGPLLEASLDAARRGVTVRLLLGGAWYVEEENRALAANLSAMAAAEGIPLEVRVVEPRSRFDHQHVKGVVVDETHTVVGSLNWNRHALRENREVAVVVTDPAIATYYTRLFRADWRGAAWRVHWGTIGALGAVLLVAAALTRKMDFEPTGEN